LTLAFFGALPSWIQSHFLNTRWTDGEFDRRLDALSIPHSSTWLGMISRKLDRVNLRMTIECLLKLPVAWWDFVRIYRSFQPDVIYLASHHQVILLWPLLVWVRHKVICHVHDPPPAIVFQKVSFFIWRRAISRFFFVSKNVRVRMARLGPLHATDVVVYNGIEVAPLHLPRRRNNRFCKMFNWSQDSVILGMTGQLIPSKGHEEFIKAACLAYESNKKIKFVIGGSGSEQFILELKRLIYERGMSDIIKFSGWLPHAIDFYEGLDIIVLASRHEEGFGLVLAEAAERGLPAIATLSGGTVEVIVDGETGILISKQDYQSLGSAMMVLAADGELRNRMGERARDRVIKEFNLIVQSNRFANLLTGSVSS
jgi:glycosyltransferase involved in cell wall biosynthesis